MRIPFGIHRGKTLDQVSVRDLAGLQTWLLDRLEDEDSELTRMQRLNWVKFTRVLDREIRRRDGIVEREPVVCGSYWPEA